MVLNAGPLDCESSALTTRPLDLTQMVNFPTWICDSNSHSLALLSLFISPDTSNCSTVTFPPLGNSDHVAVSVSIESPSSS